MATYQQVLSGYFKGDPYAYRDAILAKERTGTTLTDAAAAAAFKQAYPSLFGVPVRSTVQGAGYDVSWDPTTRAIGLGETSPAGRVDWGKLLPSDYTLIGNQAYADPATLARMVAGAPRPSPVPTPEAMKSYTDVVRPMYEPLYKAATDALNRRVSAIEAQAEQQRRLAEVGYEESRTGLERQEGRSRLAASHAASARGVSSSPLAVYGQRKVAEAYAPEYGALERRKGADLANIASQAAVAARELAAQGQELEAGYMSKLAEAAFNVYQAEVSGREAKRKDLLSMLENLSNLGWEREKYLTPSAGERLQQQRWEAEFPLKKAEVEYGLKKPYYKPETPKPEKPPTLSERASSAVKYRITAFKRPIDFAAQIKREISAGQLAPTLGNEMLKQLFVLFPSEEALYRNLK